MPIVAAPSSPSPTAQSHIQSQARPMLFSEVFAKDAIIAWFRSEFAAANAIIDALCNHLTSLTDSAGAEYDSVFTAIHRRRMNWIPVLQMQKYHSIADVAVELRRVVEKKVNNSEIEAADSLKPELKENINEEKQEIDESEKLTESEVTVNQEIHHSEITETDAGSDDPLSLEDDIQFCSDHEKCTIRPSKIKLTKGFSAKESIKGRVVNVLKGLKLYEDVFTSSELSKISNYVRELHAMGKGGKLSGDTFILFNKDMKENRRELLQLGVPIFKPIQENAIGAIEPIPHLLQGVIDHLVQWQLLPDYKKPNGCVINFFDEGEFSQPFLKPPHLDQPISTLLLSESRMAFGRTFIGGNNGNYRGPLMLTLKEGSLLLMRGNSADVARHVMCPYPTRRISITFFRVRHEVKIDHDHSPSLPPITRALTLFPSSVPNPNQAPMNGLYKWGFIRNPLVMLSPMHHMVVTPRRIPPIGTGVFFPWGIGSRKHIKQLPPRAQKGRFLSLPSPIETTSKSSIEKI